MTNSTIRLISATLAALSLAFSLFLAAMQNGEELMGFEVADSKGCIFSFNYPMSSEHMLMALKLVTVGGLVKTLGPYGILLLGLQVTSLCFLLSSSRAEKTTFRYFFLLQTMAFPVGWLLLPIGLYWIAGNGINLLDGEFFTDGPPVWIWGQAVWAPLSAAIGVSLRGKEQPSLIEKFCNRMRRTTT